MINNGDVIVSLDLETLNTVAESVILSIGAAARLPSGEVRRFNTYVQPTSQAGRAISQATLAWWKHPKRADLFTDTIEKAEAGPALKDALLEFRQWVIDLAKHVQVGGTIRPLGNGAVFDVGILEHAFQQLDIEPPWAFWNVIDLRTVKWLCEEKGTPIRAVRQGTHHDAVDDAEHQLNMLWEGCCNLTSQ